MGLTANTDKQMTVAEIVRNDYRTADIFRKWGINYCCGGAVPLAVACAARGLDEAAVQQELDALTGGPAGREQLAAERWPANFLIDYIVHVHHGYLHRVLQPLRNQLHSFVTGHLKKYPYLQEVDDVFGDLATELTEQTALEEESIFPYLKQIISTHKRRETYGSLFVRTLGKPFDQKVVTDHIRIAALLTQLRTATNDYQFAENACTNHQVIYRKLMELDQNLTMHKHLENNILYPKVLQMEKELLEV